MPGAPLVTTSIHEVQWDNAGHLYAISTSANELYGFTVKNGAATPIAGSPYPIAGVNSLAVQPLQ